MYRKATVVILLLCSTAALAADAKLLLVREGKADASCGESVIHGTLYAVPSETDLNLLTVPLGLKQLAITQELPFEANASSISSIPLGTYRGKVRTDATKAWMKGKPNRTWRIELDDAQTKRRAIQFHYGRDKGWSKGCIILTNRREESMMCSENNGSEDAVASVQAFVDAQMLSSSDSVRVKIIEK